MFYINDVVDLFGVTASVWFPNSMLMILNLYYAIYADADRSRMQASLNGLLEWSNILQLNISFKICNVFVHPLPSIKSVKDQSSAKLIEYASVAWSPCHVTVIRKIELVHRRITKRPPVLSDIPYHDRLVPLDSDSFELRRLRADLVHVHKILFGLSEIDSNSLFTLAVVLPYADAIIVDVPQCVALTLLLSLLLIE